jgi:hypothetical protein
MNVMALRLLAKDLLILFQACNEGIINVLGEQTHRIAFFVLITRPECYFEMSQVDAHEALKLYRHFCKQTERVVEFLGIAKKLENVLDVPIPYIKHVRVSLPSINASSDR